MGFSQDIEAPIGLNEVSVEGLRVSRHFDIHMAPENQRKAGVSKRNSKRFCHRDTTWDSSLSIFYLWTVLYNCFLD